MRTDSLRLAPLELNHVGEVQTIAGRSFTRVWSRSDFAYFLAHDCRLAFGTFDYATGQPRLVAYFIALLVQGDLDVVSVATLPEHRRQGLAEKLLRHACAQPRVQRAFLEVDVANYSAIALYEKLGFKVTAKRKGYYDGTQDAFVMSRNLGGQ